MKIAQVVCRYKPYKGGISNMAYNHAVGLTAKGHEVTVFTPFYNKRDSQFIADYKIKRLIPWLKLGNGALVPQLFWQLKNFDLIHLHYPFFGGAEIIWLLKLWRGQKIKLVVEYHMDVVGSGIWHKFFSWHSKYIMPRIIKAADKVIYSSQDYAEASNIAYLIKSRPDKFVAIPPSVDLVRFCPAEPKPELLAKYKIVKNFNRVLLFVGALDQAHYFKGIDFLIKSFNVLDYSGCNDKCGYQVKLLVVGGGDLLDSYQQQVNDAGLADKIIFCGYVSDKQLADHYNLADVVVLPSLDKSEAFGITLIEAMACAKPVVAANLPGVRSVFTDKQSGFSFTVLHEGDLANKINYLFMEDQLRQNMGQAARQHVINFYNKDILLAKLDHLYQQVLKS